MYSFPQTLVPMDQDNLTLYGKSMLTKFLDLDPGPYVLFLMEDQDDETLWSRR